MTGLWLALAGWGCGVQPCRSPSDCDFGTYCILSVSSSGQASGRCLRDCLSADDCPQPEDQAQRAICDNEGRCTTRARPPRLLVLEPEVDTLYEEGTRRVRVSGEVQSAAPTVQVQVSSTTEGGCYGGPPSVINVENPTPGSFVKLPFVVDGVFVDPGLTQLLISASVRSSSQRSQVLVEVACPGCAQVRLNAPAYNSGVAGLLLAAVHGSIQPAPPQAIWRVHGSTGDVFDGTLDVSPQGDFRVERLPLFAGNNRIEVVVNGIGDGLGESRCSTTVVSSASRERGLRAVLNWDGATSDLDLHLIGPGGYYGSPLSALSARTPEPSFGGAVMDDLDGRGPEILTLETVPDGVYGVVVEPVVDGDDPGSNAVLRLLAGGRTLTAGPIGPRYLSARRGQMWVVGSFVVAGGEVSFFEVDEMVSISQPPTRPPSDWPTLY